MIDLDTFWLPGGTIAFKAISGPGRRMPNSFKLSVQKVIDLETFGPPSGSRAFEAISGPGRRIHFSIRLTSRFSILVKNLP